MKLKQVVAVLSVLVGVSTSGQTQATFMTNGLVAYYPFNGNANDESGQENHGTVSGAVPATDRFGRDGQAYAFTNGVSITSIRNVGISGNQERTVSVWVKADYHPWPYGYYLGWNHEGRACTLQFPEDISYGEVRAFRFQMNAGPDYSVMSEPPGDAIQGSWHQVVWTYKTNFGSSAFYLDGRALTNFYAPGAGIPTTTLATGDNKLVMGPSFTGLMDDVRAYSRALSEQEVKDLYAYESSPNAVPVYDIAHSFSAAANPNGVWSYGWKSSLGGDFTLLSVPGTIVHENGVPVQLWDFASGTTPPLVVYNATTNTSIHDSGQGNYPPGTLYFVAGPDGTPQNFGVIRFTVPAGEAGTYHLESAVRSYLDGDRSGDTDYHVVVNNAEVFGQFLAPRSATGYTNTFNLAVGDTVDLMVGRGADGILYGSGLKIQATLSHPAVCTPHRASAIAQVVNGFMVGVILTDSGCGYTNEPPPAVRIRDASGTDATAHAVVENGQVVRVEIDNAGRGYSTNATVVIAPPPFSPTLKMEVLKVALEMSVVLGRKYQLEASTDLQTWAKVGVAFVSEDDTIRQEFDVTATGRFFRLNEVP